MKKNSKKLKNILRTLLLIIAILIIIALIVLIQINKNKVNETKSEQENVEEDEIVIGNSVSNNISKMSEEGRIESYIGEFFSMIEDENYSQAYGKLNPNFKNNYFKTIDDFEKYVKSKYPSNPNIEYSSIERIGEIYLIQTKITDVFASDSQAISQKFVIREKGLNEYTLSFEVN